MAPIDPVRTATLLAEITADSNGSLLEELIDSLFGAIPGVQRYAHDRISVSGNEEIDLAYSNTQAEDGLAHFGSDLLVECKSQGRPVSAQDVNWFATKLRRRQQNHGVLIALSGVSGRRAGYPRAGEAEVEGCAREGQQILVLVSEEIASLQSGEHLAAVLNFKRQELVAGYRMSILDHETLMALSPTRRISDSARLLLHPAASVAGEQAASWQMVLDAGRLQLRRHIRTTLEEIETRRPTAFTDTPAGVAGVKDAVAKIRTELEAVQEAVEEADAAMLAHKEPEHSEESVKEQLRLAAAVCIDLIRLDPGAGQTPELDVICVNVETFAPPRLATPVGSQLWKLLTAYYLDQIELVREQLRAAAIYALLSLLVKQLMTWETS